MLNALHFSDVIVHCGMGTLFAGTGACLRGRCKHIEHQGRRRAFLFGIGSLLVMAEGILTVAVIG